MRPGEMARSVKCLPCKHGVLSLEPQNLCKKLGMVVSTCHPSNGEMGSRDRQIPGSLLPDSLLIDKILGRWDPVSNRMWKAP